MMNIPIDDVYSILQNDGVVMLPTDTVYGLICLPENKKAVEKIYSLKARPRDMNLPIFIRDEKMAIDLGLSVDGVASSFFDSPYMPGPVTLILSVDQERAPVWLQEREEVAVRIPSTSLLLEVLEDTGPLLATSANKHGSDIDSRSFSAALMDLQGVPDHSLDGGDLKTINSTIINCRHNPPTIQRQGALSLMKIKTIINAKPIRSRD